MSSASGPGSPSWLPLLASIRVYSYFIAASSVVVAYDWALTFGQEVELVWRQRWSFTTALFLCVRYIGMSYAAVFVFSIIPSASVPVTNTG